MKSSAAVSWRIKSKEVEPKKTISPDVQRLNDVLTERLGVNAEIKTTNQKKGKIVLHFDTPETFEYLLKQLGIQYDA